MNTNSVTPPQSLRVVIVVPTYNERTNIELLIPQIVDACADVRDINLGILVVDDESPDGTADVVRTLQRKFPDLHLLSGKKAGLGAAYIRGMQFALSKLEADVIFEMDADFSHKPSDLPKLLQTLRTGADLVIGSRYVPGGSIPAEWGVHRKLNSFLGNLAAQMIAGLYPIRDCTAGFRAIRSTVLRQIDLEHIRAQGYAFQVALLHEIKILGASIVEFPVEFIDRTRGNSKLGFGDIVEFIVNCWWIRFRSASTLLKFLIVGATGVFSNLGSFALLTDMGVSKFAASPIAVEISILTNFLLNNFWTFRERSGGKSFLRRAVSFNAISLVALCVSFASFLAISALWPAIPPIVNQFLSIIPATVVNYYGQSKFTFKLKKD